MADTGAPWNLPYPLPTDLVRDGAQAIEDLAEAVATGLSAAGNPGIGANAIGATAAAFVTSSTSFVAVTGCAVTITPSSDTSRVLVLINSAAVSHGDNSEVQAQLTATSGATNILFAQGFASSGGTLAHPTSGAVLHAPGSASAVTYEVELRRAFGTGNVSIGASRIIAIEVAP